MIALAAVFGVFAGAALVWSVDMTDHSSRPRRLHDALEGGRLIAYQDGRCVLDVTLAVAFIASRAIGSTRTPIFDDEHPAAITGDGDLTIWLEWPEVAP